MLSVVNELGAAAVDFASLHLPKQGPAEQTIVVYGAGTTGVGAALVRCAVADDGAISVTVLDSEADGRVGGADVDDVLVPIAAAQFQDGYESNV